MQKRNVHDKRAAEWMLAKNATIICQPAEVLHQAPKRGGGGDMEKVTVDLFVVCFDMGFVGPEQKPHQAKVYGAPAGSVGEALAAAMKKYPLIPKQPAVAEAVADSPYTGSLDDDEEVACGVAVGEPVAAMAIEDATDIEF